MKKRLRPTLNYANVMATFAVFLALGGGAAWAATSLPKGSVGTAQLKKGAVTGAKVRVGSLLAGDFKAGQLPSGAQGPAGQTGATGTQGAAGARGPQGEPGPQGERGGRGEAGDAGPRGNPGALGPKGDQGDEGPRGPRGPEGPTGALGPEGPRGNRGFEGPQGLQGVPGPQGEPGTTEAIVRYGPAVEIGRGAVKREEVGSAELQAEAIEGTLGPRTSYAECKKGEVVTGGGYAFLRRPTVKNSYVLISNQASLFHEPSEEEREEIEEEEIEEYEVVYPAPKTGVLATGWAVTLEGINAGLVFRASVECVPG